MDSPSRLSDSFYVADTQLYSDATQVESERTVAPPGRQFQFFNEDEVSSNSDIVEDTAQPVIDLTVDDVDRMSGTADGKHNSGDNEHPLSFIHIPYGTTKIVQSTILVTPHSLTYTHTLCGTSLIVEFYSRREDHRTRTQCFNPWQGCPPPEV